MSHVVVASDVANCTSWRNKKLSDIFLATTYFLVTSSTYLPISTYSVVWWETGASAKRNLRRAASERTSNILDV